MSQGDDWFSYAMFLYNWPVHYPLYPVGEGFWTFSVTQCNSSHAMYFLNDGLFQLK